MIRNVFCKSIIIVNSDRSVANITKFNAADSSTFMAQPQIASWNFSDPIESGIWATDTICIELDPPLCVQNQAWLLRNILITTILNDNCTKLSLIIWRFNIQKLFDSIFWSWNVKLLSLFALFSCLVKQLIRLITLLSSNIYLTVTLVCDRRIRPNRMNHFWRKSCRVSICQYLAYFSKGIT